MNNNSAIEQYYNSEEAAKILGVNVSTIKRWTNENKLGCIKTAGGHRKFLFNHLTEYASKMKNFNSKLSVMPLESEQDLLITHHIMKNHIPELVDYVLKNALESNRTEIQKVISGMYLAQYPVEVIYDELVTGVLYEIGSMYEKGRISATEEHIASQSVKDCIIRSTRLFPTRTSRIQVSIC